MNQLIWSEIKLKESNAKGQYSTSGTDKLAIISSLACIRLPAVSDKLSMHRPQNIQEGVTCTPPNPSRISSKYNSRFNQTKPIKSSHSQLAAACICDSVASTPPEAFAVIPIAKRSLCLTIYILLHERFHFQLMQLHKHTAGKIIFLNEKLTTFFLGRQKLHHHRSCNIECRARWLSTQEYLSSQTDRLRFRLEKYIFLGSTLVLCMQVQCRSKARTNLIIMKILFIFNLNNNMKNSTSYSLGPDPCWGPEAVAPPFVQVHSQRKSFWYRYIAIYMFILFVSVYMNKYIGSMCVMEVNIYNMYTEIDMHIYIYLYKNIWCFCQSTAAHVTARREKGREKADSNVSFWWNVDEQS